MSYFVCNFTEDVVNFAMMNERQQSFPFQEPLERLELDKAIVFFDLETTGLDLQNDRIVQFAFLRIETSREQKEWLELVNPGIPIPVEASRIHGIKDDDVRQCPLLSEYAPAIKSFIRDCDFAGFNIAGFDVPMLCAEMERAGEPLDMEQRRIIDVKVIYHRREPRDLSAAYRFYCGREHDDAHDALSDVRATLAILEAQLERYGDLPQQTAALHDYCSSGDSRFVTRDRKLYWRHNEAYFSFGKHRGRSLKEISEEDRDYLMWMLRGDFPDQTQEVIRRALEGDLPERDWES